MPQPTNKKDKTKSLIATLEFIKEDAESVAFFTSKDDNMTRKHIENNIIRPLSEVIDSLTTMENQPTKEEIIEKLAAIEHIRWAHWQKYLHSKCYRIPSDKYGADIAFPVELFDRWERQINTPYAMLSDREKQSDREEVMKYWPLIEDFLTSSLDAYGESRFNEGKQTIVDEYLRGIEDGKNHERKALAEKIEGMKKNTQRDCSCCRGDGICTRCIEDIYNDALSEVLALLK